MTENGKKLLVLGVTGSIAAYKAAEICSALAKKAEVQVIMTANAERFVAPLTFQTLSRRRVLSSLWEDPEWKPRHVDLADEADLFLVAPATANFIAKYAAGIADDALSTFAATFHGPVFLAPAMNPAMWSQDACIANVKLLAQRGVGFIGPAAGHVACGADGVGRMADVEEILSQMSKRLA